MTYKQRIAYIAGIVDGEGYVGIKKTTYQMRHGAAQNPMYHERVQIRMHCRPVLELIRATFGGSLATEPRLYQSKTGFRSNKIMAVYCATDACAARLIAAVRPFLIAKAVQADAILALRASKNSKLARLRGGPKRRPMSPIILADREQLYRSVKAIHAA